MYEKTTRDFGFDMSGLLRVTSSAAHLPDIRYEGTEGELYKLDEDPLQWRNLWDDAGYAKIKSDLIADLLDNLPAPRNPRLEVESPV